MSNNRVEQLKYFEFLKLFNFKKVDSNKNFVIVKTKLQKERDRERE